MLHVSICTLVILRQVIFLRKPSVQVETCSTHVKVTIWVELKLCCVRLDRYSSFGTWLSGMASIWPKSSFMTFHIYTETACTGTHTVMILNWLYWDTHRYDSQLENVIMQAGILMATEQSAENVRHLTVLERTQYGRGPIACHHSASHGIYQKPVAWSETSALTFKNRASYI